MAGRNLRLGHYILAALCLLVSACATTDRLKDARNYLSRANYVPAILLYDRYIERNPHSAEQTIAQLERSECYYQLGLQAYMKKNWVLADRLLFLANSDKADKLADKVHLELANIAEKNGDTDSQLYHYNYVIHQIPGSDLVPFLLTKRIDLYLAKNQYISAYNDYKMLWDRYSETEEAIASIEVINPLLPRFLENPRYSRSKGNYAAAIAEYRLLANYPSGYQSQIYTEIAATYYQWALKDNEEEKYAEMRDHLDLAISYNAGIRNEIQILIGETCREFIRSGDAYLADGEINNAILSYRKCFILSADNIQAQEKIDFAREQGRIFAQADSLFAQAKYLENRKEHTRAQELYRQSWQLSGNPAARSKKDAMDNYIRAENNPRDFALEIIRDHRNGYIKTKVDQKIIELREMYGEQLSVSDWKAVYSYGEYNYEVRIDIYSPRESFYFAWRINLIEKSIVPLNKDSENIMK
jgi:hypothetical protein